MGQGRAELINGTPRKAVGCPPFVGGATKACLVQHRPCGRPTGNETGCRPLYPHPQIASFFLGQLAGFPSVRRPRGLSFKIDGAVSFEICLFAPSRARTTPNFRDGAVLNVCSRPRDLWHRVDPKISRWAYADCSGFETGLTTLDRALSATRRSDQMHPVATVRGCDRPGFGSLERIGERRSGHNHRPCRTFPRCIYNPVRRSDERAAVGMPARAILFLQRSSGRSNRRSNRCRRHPFVCGGHARHGLSSREVPGSNRLR